MGGRDPILRVTIWGSNCPASSLAVAMRLPEGLIAVQASCAPKGQGLTGWGVRVLIQGQGPSPGFTQVAGSFPTAAGGLPEGPIHMLAACWLGHERCARLWASLADRPAQLCPQRGACHCVDHPRRHLRPTTRPTSRRTAAIAPPAALMRPRAAQLLWVNLVTDGAPCHGAGLQPAGRGHHGEAAALAAGAAHHPLGLLQVGPKTPDLKSQTRSSAACHQAPCCGRALTRPVVS